MDIKPLLTILLSVGLLSLGPLQATPVRGAPAVIKVAVVTPEGSAWTDALHRLAAKVEKETDGQLKLKIYAGGISGDEMDVLRKMRANRLQAAGFSGVGLGVILPRVRVLEAPLLYRDYAEIDRVKAELSDHFSAAFAGKGYVLLGFVEGGFVYLFSKQPMTGPDGVKATKMWVWQGDPVAKTVMEAFGVRTTPLNVADVNTGLETGMIDAFYAPPMAAVAFQWHAKIRFLLDYPLVHSTGALLIRKNTFDGLPRQHRQVLARLSRKYCRELVRLARQESSEALKVLKAGGITFEVPSAEQIASFEQSAHRVRAVNADTLYSRDLLDKVETILKSYRDNSQ